MSNPFFESLPSHGVPNFAAIKTEHYRDAFDRAFRGHLEEMAVITENADPANFANTIEAMDRSGKQLAQVGDVFFNLTSSDTNDALQALELEIMPEFAAHESRIYTNTQLFDRVRQVMESKKALDPEQAQLLSESYSLFVRAGAALKRDARERVNAINEELAGLSTQFTQNVLKGTNQFELVLETEQELAGLPDFVRSAALAEGKVRNHPGKCVFTISRSSITPFLQYADRRDLREKMYRAYAQCGGIGQDNHPIIKRVIALRSERAQLLGFESHAHYMLDDRMAKTPDAVLALLDKIWAPCQLKVEQEAQDLRACIAAQGDDFELAPWDWWYYTEKVRHTKFDLDEDEVKPYFKLENVRDGAFEVARKLYGITFTPRHDLPMYHPDVECYDAHDADGSVLGIFLMDFYMRPSKGGGAWMSEFRGQSNLDERIRPVIVNCCNFPKSEPCLLGMDEVRTLFHEFGHGLHGLLSNVRYSALAGTNVKQDFVELPSQIMEHWAIEPEVLRSYATHHQSGESIPDALIEKLLITATFNQGFATTEYLAASYLDMAWHYGDSTEIDDIEAFEGAAMQKIGLINMVDPRYKSSYFQHIFSGDSYSAGYYAYIWAEVLDADGFEAFKENGLFDQATAQAFRTHILEKGGTENPMELYKAFRGREPDVAPLLKSRGLA